MIGRIRVFGPAYLDRVLRVDGPLREPSSPPLDSSVEARPGFGAADGLTLLDPVGASIVVDLPTDWAGPWGIVALDRPIGLARGDRRSVRAVSWGDDLGGMGAGFGSALGGELVAALGPAEDPTSEAVARLLDEHAVATRILRVDRPADWTLLLTSGEHGDKLAVGFRSGGCHGAMGESDLAPFADDPCDVRVVAGLPNRLAAGLLRAPGARARVFAPAMRNVMDRDWPLLGLIGPVDVLCCNRGEWEWMADREEVAARLSILIVTEGSAGSTARFTDPSGSARSLRTPAFPRARPPRDTNRAGEAFAAFFLSSMFERGWGPESCTADVELIRFAMTRASAAAALVLDLTGFGFPTASEVDSALARGVVD